MISILLSFVIGATYVIKSHEDFSAGWEGCLIDTVLHIHSLGSHIFSPRSGGLRLIAEDSDLDDNGFEDIIVSADSVYIFFNNGNGFEKFSLPARDPQGVSIQDINMDGFPDLLVAEKSDDSHIYYMTEFGFTPSMGEVVHSVGAQMLLPCDINNDGYLDIVVSNSGIGGNLDVTSYIYFGPPPFSGRTPDYELPVPGAHEVTLVDVDDDGYLDLVFSSERREGGQNSSVHIFWGDSAGFSPYRVSLIPVTLNWSHSFADLDGDGYLDLVVDIGNGPDRIYFGTEFGFGSYINLRGNAPGHLYIYDVNGDRNLDIIESQVGGALFISYGPNFDNFSEFPVQSGHSLSLLDIDGDEILDLVVGDDQASLVKIFRGTPQGFIGNPYIEIEVSGIDDGSWFERGNFYGRGDYFYFTPILGNGDTIKFDSVKIFGDFPGQTEVNIYIRSGFARDTLSKFVLFSENTEIFPTSFIQLALEIKPDWRYTSSFKVDSLKVFYHYPQEFLRSLSISPHLLVDSLVPGNSRFYILDVINDGELPLSIELDTLGPSNLICKISRPDGSPLLDQDGDGFPELGSLEPQDTQSVRIDVIAPDTLIGGFFDTLCLCAFSENFSTVRDSTLLVVFIKNKVLLRIYPDRYDSTDPGVPLPLSYFVRNDGDSVDIGELEVEGLIYPYQLLDSIGNPLIDSDGDGKTDTGPIQPGESLRIILEVIPPPGVYPGERDTGIVLLISSRDSSNVDFAYAGIKIKGNLSIEMRLPQHILVVKKGRSDLKGSVVLKGVLGDTLEFSLLEPHGWRITLRDTLLEEIQDIDGDGFLECGPIEDTLTFFIVWVEALEDADTASTSLLVRSASYPLLMDSVNLKLVRVEPPSLRVIPKKDGTTSFILKSDIGGKLDVKLYDRVGRLLREIESPVYPGREEMITWDGRDKYGRSLIPGVYIYFVEFRSSSGELKKWKGRLLKEK